LTTARDPARKRSTIRDVALAAGVSVATVSRVLSGNDRVSAELRERVMQVANELDHVTNVHARSLAGGGPRTIAMLIGDITGPSFAHAARAVEREAAVRGCLTLICTTENDPERELTMVNLMRQQEYDNEGGAFAMTSHLLAAGHRGILMLPGPRDQTTALGRLSGYRKALSGHNVPEDPCLIGYGPYEHEIGRRAVTEALDRGVNFSAVFAGTDVVAAGALEALRAAGKRVPEDVSLAGYDDIPLARDLTPKLTTVHVPYEEIGRAAARLALDRGRARTSWSASRWCRANRPVSSRGPGRVWWRYR